MEWIVVFTAPLEKDLSAFSHLLSHYNIVHRIIERDGQQVLLTYGSQHSARVRAWFEQWDAGDMYIAPAPAKTISYFAWLSRIGHYPVVLMTVLLATLGALATESSSVLSWFTFQDTVLDEQGRIYVTGSTQDLALQWWRVITPIFLHFGLLHLVFNSLWTIEFGRRIESAQTGFRLIAVILVTGAISNICQYIYQPDHVFGGLSGVVYGLLGYCWLWGWKYPQSQLAPPPGVAKFLLIWLVVCMTGVLSVLGIHIANAAHVAGLASGLLLAWGTLHFKTLSATR